MDYLPEEYGLYRFKLGGAFGEGTVLRLGRENFSNPDRWEMVTPAHSTTDGVVDIATEAIFGDTSQDGSRYDSLPDLGILTGNAVFFSNHGNDVNGSPGNNASLFAKLRSTGGA